MVGVAVFAAVGVEVEVGVCVGVGVLVGVAVGVLVIVGVSVHEAAVAVMASAVIVAFCAAEGPQAAKNSDRLTRNNNVFMLLSR